MTSLVRHIKYGIEGKEFFKVLVLGYGLFDK